MKQNLPPLIRVNIVAYDDAGGSTDPRDLNFGLPLRVAGNPASISAGCTNCYAMEMTKRLQSMKVEKYQGLTRRSGNRTLWNGVVREDRAALDIPLRWKRPKKDIR
jgi:Protein of unknown function (DUF5131)